MANPIAQTLDYFTQATNQKLVNEKLFNSADAWGANGIKPWLERPSEWEDFSPTNVTVLGAVGTDTTLLSFFVPTGKDGVIEALFFEYTASAFNLGDIVYRVFINDRPVKNLEQIKTNLGSSQIPFQFRLRIQSGNTVTLVVSHLINGTLDGKEISAGIKGYLYRRSEV